MGYMEELEELTKFIENDSTSLKEYLKNDPESLKRVEDIDNKMMSKLNVLRSKTELLKNTDNFDRIQIMEEINKEVATLRDTYDNEYRNLLIDLKHQYQAITESNEKKIADLEKKLRWYMAMDDREKAGRKLYPNDSCPCGSGKKYKKCCGNPNRDVINHGITSDE